MNPEIYSNTKLIITMKKLSEIVLKVETCIEMQNGATESQLRDILNDLNELLNTYKSKDGKLPIQHVVGQGNNCLQL